MALTQAKVDRVNEALAKFKRAHDTIYAMFGDILHEKIDSDNMGDLGDLHYLAKQFEEQADSLRKEAIKLQEICSYTFSADWMMAAMMAPGTTPETITGRFAKAKADVKHVAVLPVKGTPERAKLLRFLGIPEDKEELVSIHWPNICKLLEKLASAGKPTPPGIDPKAQKTEYVLRTRSVS